MKKEYKNIEESIKENLSTEEYEDTQELINELKNMKSRGYFTKKGFLKMAK